MFDLIVDEFVENEDLFNIINFDDWVWILGKKGEWIVYICILVIGKSLLVSRVIDIEFNFG